MNANELADLIGLCGDGGYNQDAATMLRQQQYEIEDLKNANRFIQNFAQEQHQRAVALEMRELTNEEISDIRDEFFAPDGCNIYTFARALLKKAQGND
jgi:ssRNA-specific RNase YbeY (16S rRNA maturation enzyme)